MTCVIVKMEFLSSEIRFLIHYKRCTPLKLRENEPKIKMNTKNTHGDKSYFVIYLVIVFVVL